MSINSENNDLNLQKSPQTWKKRILKIALTIIIPVIILYILLAAVPYFIKPEAADVLNKGISKIWVISNVIQYGIYAAIAFFFYPKMVSKKRTKINIDLEMLDDASQKVDLSDQEYYVLNEQISFQMRKLNKINTFISLKSQWIVMGVLIIFDLVAGQLPYMLITS
ncbi:hypothetical protein AwWohl_01520 [Gammaproteobacteria bacterium]|nr:hypothetical protein AwWohl_01520 [Gammaproteobacteria bacterium]